MYNLNNLGIFNNTSGTASNVNTSGSTISQATNEQAINSARDTVNVLKNMLAGDTFNGKITDINGNKLILQLNDGTNISALLQGDSDINVGQNITFMVSDNTNNTISIKPMFMNEQEAMLINKVLDAAGVLATEKSVELIKELLKQNMSIDKNTVLNLTKQISKFPDANIDTLVRLNKLGIPITQENINQFESYKSYEHSISNELNILSNSTGHMLADITNTSTLLEAANTSKSILDILYSSENSTNRPDSSAAEVKSGIESKLSGTNNELVSQFMNNGARESLSNNLIAAFGKSAATNLINDIANGNISAKDILEQINQLIIENHASLSKEQISHLFNSKDYSNLMKLVIRDRMRITPEDVKTSDNINDFYKRVHSDVEKLSRAVEQTSKDSQFFKELSTIKNNIEFMNDLNRNMTYFQVPIKFSQSDANGELYVFTNKKSIKSSSENLSALLHLDMENLGQVDIFVRLAGKNLSTDFCLENEEMLDFVYSHIDKLNARLEALGYNVKFEMKVQENDNDDESHNIMDSFIGAGNDTISTTQFIFDTKA